MTNTKKAVRKGIVGEYSISFWFGGIVIISLIMTVPQANWFALIWIALAVFEYSVVLRQRSFIKEVMQLNQELVDIADENEKAKK